MAQTLCSYLLFNLYFLADHQREIQKQFHLSKFYFFSYALNKYNRTLGPLIFKFFICHSCEVFTFLFICLVTRSIKHVPGSSK